MPHVRLVDRIELDDVKLIAHGIPTPAALDQSVEMEAELQRATEHLQLLTERRTATDVSDRRAAA